MIVEVEYTIRKRATIECEGLDSVMGALLKSQWVSGHQLLERKPTITNKLIIDDSIAVYDKETESITLKIERPKKIKVETVEEWREIYKVRMAEIQKENPHFSDDKVRYFAKMEMPDLPTDGWK